MKKLDSITTVLLFGLGLFSLMAFTTYRASIQPLEQLKTEPIVELLVKPLIIDSVELELTSHQQFLDAMGHRESSNNYKAVNKYGYMGKYQFGRSTLKTLKINVSRSEFINNPKLQEQAIYKLKESKDLFDLGLMNEEEYNLIKKELTPIIMGN